MTVQTSLKQIFISQTRLKLINILFYIPSDIYYVRQLVRLVDEEINSVRRELDNLKKAGIVESEQRGNRLYYCANRRSSLFSDLVVLANKSVGLGSALQSKKDRLGNIKMLIYSYKFMTDRDSTGDIDLIIVGDVVYSEVENHIKQEQEKRGREINYMVMDKNELKLRRQKRDQFIVDFFLDCPSVIIGDPTDLK